MAREPGFKSFRVENSGGTVYRQSTVLCFFFMGPESRFGADVGVPINAWMTESGECVANGLDPKLDPQLAAAVDVSMSWTRVQISGIRLA